MRRQVLDANALYCFLNGGQGTQIVAELFKGAVVAGTTVMLSAVNWGEVYYTLVKRIGIVKAKV